MAPAPNCNSNSSSSNNISIARLAPSIESKPPTWPAERAQLRQDAPIRQHPHQLPSPLLLRPRQRAILLWPTVNLFLFVFFFLLSNLCIPKLALIDNQNAKGRRGEALALNANAHAGASGAHRARRPQQLQRAQPYRMLRQRANRRRHQIGAQSMNLSKKAKKDRLLAKMKQNMANANPLSNMMSKKQRKSHARA